MLTAKSQLEQILCNS